MTNFSKDQLDKIRALLEKVGVKPECPACKKGMLVIDRGQFGLQEVTQSRENPHGSVRRHRGIDGEDRNVRALGLQYLRLRPNALTWLRSAWTT